MTVHYHLCSPLMVPVVLLLLTPSTFLLPLLLWVFILRWKNYSKAALYTAEYLESGKNSRGRQV